jgi:hypothetical protein
VCDVGALRRIRGQRRPYAHHRPAVNHDDVDQRRYDDEHRTAHHDRADDHQHRPPVDADDRSEDDRDHRASHGPHDRHHREESRADDRLHSSDDRAGHDDDGLFVDAVRSGDLLLGP